jgi:hypothetical protein
VKCRLLVEDNDVPLGLEIDGADRKDFKILRITLESVPIDTPNQRQKFRGSVLK